MRTITKSLIFNVSLVVLLGSTTAVIAAGYGSGNNTMSNYQAQQQRTSTQARMSQQRGMSTASNAMQTNATQQERASAQAGMSQQRGMSAASTNAMQQQAATAQAQAATAQARMGQSSGRNNAESDDD